MELVCCWQDEVELDKIVTCFIFVYVYVVNIAVSNEKKEEIWLSPMTKAHTPTEMSKGQSDNINNATKKFDYTAVADRLRTVSWSNYSHPTGVVNRFTGPPSH